MGNKIICYLLPHITIRAQPPQARGCEFQYDASIVLRPLHTIILYQVVIKY